MNRSEACVVVLLQKSSEAKRSYGTLMGATGIFGETDDLFYHYSDHLYKEVLLNAYKEANIDPAKVAYIEGEGLGIKVCFNLFKDNNMIKCFIKIKLNIMFMIYIAYKNV